MPTRKIKWKEIIGHVKYKVLGISAVWALWSVFNLPKFSLVNFHYNQLGEMDIPKTFFTCFIRLYLIPPSSKM